MDDCSPNLRAGEYRDWEIEASVDVSEEFDTPGGLTRSWNAGLGIAQRSGSDIAIVGNSDTVFTPGWDRGIVAALNQFHLVGPVTNAAGWGSPAQRVQNYIPGYQVSDDEERLGEASDQLLGFKAVELAPPKFQFGPQGVLVAVPEFINGFTMAARMETWQKHKFDADHYFNPAYPMTENEVELQLRWRWAGLRIGIAPSSFVFHYRSVSRGDQFLCEGAFRKA